MKKLQLTLCLHCASHFFLPQIMDLPKSHSHVYEDATGALGVRDQLDDAESTVHFLVRNPKSGKVVSSIRTVDASRSQLEMERFGWWKISDEMKKQGAVEWCRLVADPSARGSTAAPMLYIQSVRYHQDKTNEWGGNQNFVFMVDQRATKLLKYYHDYTPTVQLSPEPVRCDEYELGRKSYVLNMPMGEEGSLARAKFQANVYWPAVLGTCFMKSYRDLKVPEPMVN
jgi:hypothetical protein